MLNGLAYPVGATCVDFMQTGERLPYDSVSAEGIITRRTFRPMPRDMAEDACGLGRCPHQLPALDDDIAQGFGAVAFLHGWHGAVDRVLGPKRWRADDEPTIADHYREWQPLAIVCAMERLTGAGGVERATDVNQAVGYCRGSMCRVAPPVGRRGMWLAAAGAGALALWLAR
jgi:hypothetical protein